MMDKITLRVGTHTLRGVHGETVMDHVVAVERLIERIEAECGIDAEVGMYQGIELPFGGCRDWCLRDVGHIAYFANPLNQNGHSFSLALNGGLTLEEQIHPDDLEAVKPALDLLAENNEQYGHLGVRNVAIMEHPALVAMVNERYGGVDLNVKDGVNSNPNRLLQAASCVRQLDSRTWGYGEDFENFDYVCLLPQHDASEIIAQFPQYVRKMIIILNSQCHRRIRTERDADICIRHYRQFEQKSAYSGRTPRSRENIEFEQDPRCCNYEKRLLNMPKILIGYMVDGIDHFKFERSRRFLPSELQTLIYCVNQANAA
jgi:hypothetical protein